jgi:cystathionine beta-lyase/cystathionine gamma-synthase
VMGTICIYGICWLHVLGLRNLSVRVSRSAASRLASFLQADSASPSCSIISYAEATVRSLSHKPKAARAEAARERTGPAGGAVRGCRTCMMLMITTGRDG